MKIRRLIASFLMVFVFLAADVVVPDLAQLMGKQNKYGIVYAFSGKGSSGGFKSGSFSSGGSKSGGFKSGSFSMPKSGKSSWGKSSWGKSYSSGRRSYGGGSGFSWTIGQGLFRGLFRTPFYLFGSLKSLLKVIIIIAIIYYIFKRPRRY